MICKLTGIGLFFRSSKESRQFSSVTSLTRPGEGLPT